MMDRHFNHIDEFDADYPEFSRRDTAAMLAEVREEQVDGYAPPTSYFVDSEMHVGYGESRLSYVSIELDELECVNGIPTVDSLVEVASGAWQRD